MSELARCWLTWLGCIYRVIHKSLRDFRPLRYSSRDGNAEGEHVNRARDVKKNGRDSLPIDMLPLAASVLVVGQPSSEIPEGLMNYPVYTSTKSCKKPRTENSYSLLSSVCYKKWLTLRLLMSYIYIYIYIYMVFQKELYNFESV